jgi:hypothetical protein
MAVPHLRHGRARTVLIESSTFRVQGETARSIIPDRRENFFRPPKRQRE